MNSPLISVIIPAYNAEEFLEECLESVRRQTFGNFEAIIVDDCSHDRTTEIARHFVKKDGRFHLLSLPDNKGLSGARNAGIKIASGEYLFFLDSDDCIYPQSLELMVKTLIEEEARICRTSFKRGTAFVPQFYPDINKVTFDNITAIRLTLYQKILMNSACAMLIDRQIVEQCNGFNNGIWYEDLDSFYRFFEKAERISYIEQPLYFYRQNPRSFINTWSDARLDVLDVTDRMVEFFQERYPELEDAAKDRRFSAHYNMLLLMKKHHIKNPEAMDRCRRIIREGRMRALKDPSVRLKNKVGALLSFLFT